MDECVRTGCYTSVFFEFAFFENLEGAICKLIKDAVAGILQG